MGEKKENCMITNEGPYIFLNNTKLARTAIQWVFSLSIVLHDKIQVMEPVKKCLIQKITKKFDINVEMGWGQGS